ncbi:MAG: YidC/Oxa1 family membrane protein insertase [Candidatus Flemingiibacterium sp.]
MTSIWDIINIPLGWILKLGYELTHNYALALFFFALVLQIILFPLGIKQQKNSVKQASLRPKEMAIRNKYAGRTDKPTQDKLNQEIMELYQRENFNPMGGCLPMLIQLPIIFSLYNVVISPLKYVCGFTVDTINAIQAKVYEIMSTTNMTGFEAFAEGKAVRQLDLLNRMRELGVGNFLDNNGSAITEEMLPNFSIFGGMMDLSQTPSFTNFNLLLLIPLLTLIVTLGSTFITRKLTYNPNPEAQNDMSMKIMNLTMPLLSVYISFTIAAAIGLYWVFRNILSIIQQVILVKMFPIPKFTEEDYKAAEREANMSKRQIKKAEKQKVRSLHRIDEDDPIDGAPAPAQPQKTPEPESDDDSDAQKDKKPELKEGVNPDDAPKLK